MFEELTKLIYDYSNNGKFADIDFVLNAVSIISEYYNINNYIKDLIIIPLDKDKKSYKGSSYDLNDMILSVDLTYEMNKHKYSFKSDRKKCLYYNLEIIKILLHEFDHILLKRQFDLKSNTIDVILAKRIFDYYNYLSFSYSNPNPTIEDKYNIVKLENAIEYYYFNHNKAPFERRANIHALLYMYEIIKIFNNTKYKDKIKFYEKKCINKYIKFIKEHYKVYKGYSFTNSPSFDYFIGLDYKNSNTINEVKLYRTNKIKSFNNVEKNYCLYDKILYGLQISEDELNHIKSLKKMIYKN